MLPDGKLFMLSAVIFDFDGVIVDSEPIHYQAFQAVLDSGGKEFSWEEYREHYLGFDDRDVFRKLFESGQETLAKIDLDRLIAAKAKAFQLIFQHATVKPFPGVVDLIRDLSGKIPIALCSGGRLADILPILRMLEIENAFKVIVTAEDTLMSKPDPAPYLLAIRNLGLADAARAIAIEDSMAGISSAKNAGLNVLAVTNSRDSAQLPGSHVTTTSLENINRRSLEDMIS
jgi:beta-phosphoglucomutase